MVGKKRDIRVQHKPTRVSKDPRGFKESTFICTECGNKMYLYRDVNKRRSKGHIKTMYCPFCKNERMFKEIRDIDHIIYDEKKEEVKDNELNLFGSLLAELIKQNPNFVQQSV